MKLRSARKHLLSCNTQPLRLQHAESDLGRKHRSVTGQKTDSALDIFAAVSFSIRPSFLHNQAHPNGPVSTGVKDVEIGGIVPTQSSAFVIPSGR